MPLFNDRRNSNPATDIADYSDPSKRTWRDANGNPAKQIKTTGSVTGYKVPTGIMYGNRAEYDRSQINAGLTSRAGRGDAAKDPGSYNGQAYYSRKGAGGYAADAAEAGRWIKMGEVYSDKARAAKAKTKNK